MFTFLFCTVDSFTKTPYVWIVGVCIVGPYRSNLAPLVREAATVHGHRDLERVLKGHGPRGEGFVFKARNSENL